MSRDRLDSAYFRLSDSLVPIRYDVELAPHSSTAVAFRGRAAIRFTVREPLAASTRQLVLHALRLTFDAANICFSAHDAADRAPDGPPPVHAKSVREPYNGSVFAPPLTSVACTGVATHNGASETVLLTFAAPLPNTTGEQFTVYILGYRGVVYQPRESAGIYRCSPRDPKFLATHCEPTQARRILPCYDEPRFRAVYRLSIVSEADYTVVSNTPIASEELVPSGSLCNGDDINGANDDDDDDDIPLPGGEDSAPALKRVTFTETPWLHSCIVSFAIGKFHKLTRTTAATNVECSVIFPDNQPPESGQYALDTLVKAVEFFRLTNRDSSEGVYNTATIRDGNGEVPLEKVDLVSLEVLAFLGMENWGAVHLLQDYMLVSAATPIARRQRIARLIAHEVLHLRWGCWISVEDFRYLWLKEGMARFLEYTFVDAAFPEWRMWCEFTGTITDNALTADADLGQTHPVEYCDPRPRRILDSFDAISYGKGAALLRTLFTALGPEVREAAEVVLVRRRGQRCFGPAEFAASLVDAVEQCATTGSGRDLGTAVIDSVMALSLRAGHPYVLITQITNDNEGASTAAAGVAYRISQYRAPPMEVGLTAYYVGLGDGGGGGFSLLSPPPSSAVDGGSGSGGNHQPQQPGQGLRRFVWEPSKALKEFSDADPPYTFPLEILDWPEATAVANFSATAASQPPHPPRHHRGPTTLLVSESTRLYRPTESSSSNGPSVVAPPLFNYRGSGVLRLDHDTATWRGVFAAARDMTDEGRMAVTASLARMRLCHMGLTAGDAAGAAAGADRCTLFLEWVAALVSHEEQHQQSPDAADGDYCPVMSSFLWARITEELTALLPATRGARCHAALRAFIAQVVYRPLYGRQALSLLPGPDRTDSFVAAADLPASTTAAIAVLLGECGYGGGGGGGVAADGMALVAAALAGLCPGAPAYALPPDGPITAAAAPSIDFSNSSHVAVVLATLVAAVRPTGPSSTRERRRHVWAAAVGAVDAVTRLGVGALEAAVGGGLSIPDASHDEGEGEGRSATTMRLVRMETAMPAMLAYEDEPAAFSYLAAVLDRFNNITESAMAALCGNTPLLLFLLERELDPWLLRRMLNHAGRCCGSGAVAVAIKSAVFTATGNAEAAEKCATVQFIGGCGGGGDCEAAAGLSDDTAESLVALEARCVWLDYSDAHLERFLRAAVAASPSA